MIKICTCLIVSLCFCCATMAQPDFRKAVKHERHQPLGQAFPIDDYKVFNLLNACEIGSYQAKVYMMRDSVLFHVLDLDIVCFNNSSSDVIPANKKKLYSSSIPRLTEGHWFIDIPNVRCGYVFEFFVDKNGDITANKYEFGCQ